MLCLGGDGGSHILSPFGPFNGTPSIFRNATRGPGFVTSQGTCNNAQKALDTIPIRSAMLGAAGEYPLGLGEGTLKKAWPLISCTRSRAHFLL